jgi:hypothetical protein
MPRQEILIQIGHVAKHLKSYTLAKRMALGSIAMYGLQPLHLIPL